MTQHLRFHKGETIVSEKTYGDKTFIIRQGHVLVFKTGPEGEVIPLSQLGPGEMFGEMYLLHQNGLRNASIIAIDDVEVEIVEEAMMIKSLGVLSCNQKQMLSGLATRLVNTTDSHIEARQPKRHPV